MKSLATILFLQLTTATVVAQGIDSKIKAIEAQCAEIRSQVSTNDTKRIDTGDESTEGGQATAYYSQGELKLIEVEWFGETGKRSIDYYFSNGALILASNKDFTYNRPIYWDKKKAEENDDSEIHNPNKTKLEENTYYFENGKLVRWLGNDRKNLPLDLETNEYAQGLIEHTQKLRKSLAR